MNLRPLERDFRLFEEEDRFLWATFIFAFLGLLLFDNLYMFSQPVKLTFKTAVMYTIFWVMAALAFCLWVGCWQGSPSSLQWSSGYTLQWMMSFDNLFVFHLIFKVYGTPDDLKHRPLFLGIVGAVVLTLTGLTCGEYVFNKLYFLHMFFGLFFIYIGVSQCLFDDDDEDPTQIPLVQWLQRNFRFVSIYDTQGHFFVQLPIGDDGKVYIPPEAALGSETCFETDGILPPQKGGKDQESDQTYKSTIVDLSKMNLSPSQKTECRATMLFLVLCTIEISDVMFSMDTIVAISSQVPDLFLAFSCVAFALLTLRATFFIVEVLAEMFSLMKYGIAGILIYIGVKLLIDRWVIVPHLVDSMVLVIAFGSSFVASAIYDSMYEETEEGENGSAEKLLTQTTA